MIVSKNFGPILHMKGYIVCMELNGRTIFRHGVACVRDVWMNFMVALIGFRGDLGVLI